MAYVAEVFTEYRRGNLVAKDADTQARLDAAEAARQARIAEMREDKAIRRPMSKPSLEGAPSVPGTAPLAKAGGGCCSAFFEGKAWVETLDGASLSN